MLYSNHKKEDGVTLIEILVVVLIIGILAGIAIPLFLNQRNAASEVSLKTDVKNAGTLLGGQSKFAGTLPVDLRVSPGVTLTALRKSDRDNKVQSSQFADGTAPSWASFFNGANGTTQIVTNMSDGYKGMNYRRLTSTSGTGTSGQFVGFDLPELAQKGDDYRVGVAMRHSYTGCRNINIEFKGAGGLFVGGISTTQICFQKDEWQFYEAPGKINGNDVNRVVMSLYASNVGIGQTFDVTAAVIVKGNTINSEAALDTTGYDYCIQGYHEYNPNNIWSYSNLDGGLRNERC